MAVYSKDRKQSKKGRFVTIILLLIIILGIFYLVFSNELFAQESELLGTVRPIGEDQNKIEEKKQDEIVSDISNIPKKMGNYEVLGQLVMDKIGVNKNILISCDNKSLNLSLARWVGPSVNEPGNLCICGHNWGSMLKKLSEMQVGDTFYMISRRNKTKVNYKVYKVYTCGPRDLSCVESYQKGTREVTIITCTPGGAKRVVCKARET